MWKFVCLLFLLERKTLGHSMGACLPICDRKALSFQRSTPKGLGVFHGRHRSRLGGGRQTHTGRPRPPGGLPPSSAISRGLAGGPAHGLDRACTHSLHGLSLLQIIIMIKTERLVATQRAIRTIERREGCGVQRLAACQPSCEFLACVKQRRTQLAHVHIPFVRPDFL